MSEELRTTIYKYIENSKINYYGNQKNEMEEFSNFLNSQIMILDRPDGFCKIDNNVLIIEHFEFDSSSVNKKGSRNRKELARVDRELTGDKSFDIISCDYTMKNYINNVKKILNFITTE